MKTLLLSILFSLFLFGCSSTDNGLASSTDSTKTIKIAAGTQTCLKGIPNNTFAVSRLTGEKVAVGTNGCFDITNTTTGRIAASGITYRSTETGTVSTLPDTIVLVNDSSIFSLTIPMTMLGDTFQMVQTTITIQRAKVGEYDSVLAIVYDTAHIKERKAAMRWAYDLNSIDYNLNFYSPDTGKPFQIHYEFHKGDSIWTSELITAQPGSSFIRNDTELAAGSVPKFDTTSLINEYGSNWIDTIKPTSIYGIQSITIDGNNTNTFSDTAWGWNIHSVKVLDKAGYSNIVKINSFVGHTYSASELNQYQEIVSDTGLAIADTSLTPEYMEAYSISYKGHLLQNSVWVKYSSQTLGTGYVNNHPITQLTEISVGLFDLKMMGNTNIYFIY